MDPVDCELCQQPTCRKGWKQRFCKTCVPNRSARQRAVRYGLSQQMFDVLLTTQNFCCAICKGELHSKHINGTHVDHDHSTGKVRGLLCGTCNATIGYIERLKRLDVYEKVKEYLNAHC